MEDPKYFEWVGSDGVTRSISVPRNPGESNSDWEVRYQRIKQEGIDHYGEQN